MMPPDVKQALRARAAARKAAAWTLDELASVVDATARFAVWGISRDGLVMVPATLTGMSPTGRALVFRREDDGAEVRATARMSERSAWVAHHIVVGGWWFRRNVWVQLTEEVAAAAAVVPAFMGALSPVGDGIPAGAGDVVDGAEARPRRALGPPWFR